MKANERSKSVDTDDAMFTKKSVGPMDCASCDKGIVNLYGMRADHLSWNRLPFREPNERIAKVSFNLKSNTNNNSMGKAFLVS